MINEKTKYGVLCLLNNKSCMGSDIKTWHEYGMRNNYFTDPDPIFPKLAELEKLGWISTVGSSEGLEPAQKTYQITDAGRKEFFRWRDEGRFLPGNIFPDLTIYQCNE